LPVRASIGIQASRSRASWTISSEIWFCAKPWSGGVAQAGGAGVQDAVLATGALAVAQFEPGDRLAGSVGGEADTSGF
jgi:hypothetical protein